MHQQFIHTLANRFRGQNGAYLTFSRFAGIQACEGEVNNLYTGDWAMNCVAGAAAGPRISSLAQDCQGC